MTSHAARIALAALVAGAAAGPAERTARAEPIAQAAPAPAPAVPSAPSPSAAPAATAEDRALDHLDRGVAAYRAGDYVRARTELTAASELAPDRPNPYRWLALAEAALGDCASALAHVEGFLSRVAPGDPRVGEMVALRDRCLRNERAAAAAAAPGGAASRPDSAARTPLPSLPPTAMPAGDAPLVRRWWFWAAIGAVAIAAGGATYELTRGSPSRLPPVTCDPAGCHP